MRYSEAIKRCQYYIEGVCVLLKNPNTCVVERGATDNCPAYTAKQIEEFIKEEEFKV